jgi:hypothetical protein
MKIGFRVPSISKRIAARTSPKRFVRQNLGLKVPRGMGWLTNPKKAAYNRVYRKTTTGCLIPVLSLVVLPLAIIVVLCRLM